MTESRDETDFKDAARNELEYQYGADSVDVPCFRDDDVEWVEGGAWVTCRLFVSDEEAGTEPDEEPTP